MFVFCPDEILRMAGHILLSSSLWKLSLNGYNNNIYSPRSSAYIS